MNITITLEELRDYQSRMFAWTEAAMRTEAVINAAKTMRDWDMRGSMDPMGRLHKAAEEWLAANPMPKLVPKELEP